MTGGSERPGHAPPPHASVVIIGGGVIGVSCAFHLAEAGVDDVVLIERDELGSGSSRATAGGVRAQFSDPLNVQLAQRSLDAFERFASRPGVDARLRRWGYLFLLTRQEDLSMFELSLEVQRRHGVPSRLVTPREALRLCPLLDVGDVVAAAFSPMDGFVDPSAVIEGYATAARAHGARIVTRCNVTDIAVDGGQIRCVLTDRGTIDTGVVICAAGAWARACGGLVGVDLPVTPVRRQVVITAPVPELPPTLPMTIDFASGLHFHRHGDAVRMGIASEDDSVGFDSQPDHDWLPRLEEAVGARAPKLARVGFRDHDAGFYEMAPDHNAIVGESGGVSRFLYATGFSGHGFLQAPAIGEVMRDLVLERTPFVDVSAFAVERFENPSTLRVEMARI